MKMQMGKNMALPCILSLCTIIYCKVIFVENSTFIFFSQSHTNDNACYSILNYCMVFISTRVKDSTYIRFFKNEIRYFINLVNFGLDWFCGPQILRYSDGSSLIWDITSSPSGVEPPSTKQLELQTAWDKGGILQPVLS